MRQHDLAEFGKLRQVPLAIEEWAAELLLETLDGARQCRLRDIASLSGAGEVERFRQGEEVADLKELHRRRPRRCLLFVERPTRSAGMLRKDWRDNPNTRLGKVSLGRFRDGSRQQIDFAVQRREQTIEPVAAQYRAELRALGRQLANRAVEVDVRDLPDTLILTQQVVDADRLAARLDNTRPDHGARTGGLLPGHLQLLARITVETLSITRRDITRERHCHLLLLGGRERVPGAAYGNPRH